MEKRRGEMSVISVAFFACIWACIPSCVNGTTDENDILALNVLFGSLNSPSKLQGWTADGGDPCGQSWQGITCSGSSVRAIKLTGLELSGNLDYNMNIMTSLTEIDTSNNRLGGGGSIQYNLPPNLEKLNLANNQFGGNLPYSISLMTALKYLNLAHNQLQGTLKDMFESLTNLTTLDLSFNSFTGDLPPSFDNLTRLTTLYLQNNQFTSYIDVLAFLPLKTLNVENNRFTGWIPDQLKRIKSLMTEGNLWNSRPKPPPAYMPPPPVYRPLPEVSHKPQGSSSSNHAALFVGLAVGVLVISLAILYLILLCIQRKRILNEEYEQALHVMNVKPDIFSYAEMRTATKNFSSSNILGEGGYGSVFKGKLSDGRTVAVKQLSVKSHQGKEQFLTEIETISAVRHCNLVKLHGYCIERNKRILVYEFLENKSLDQAIFGKNKLHIDWPKRFEICLGVARGLAYLHEESSVPIIHRDVKASNILLDADLKPKISDFGLAKLFDEKKTHVTTKVAGTIGYLAPEYAMRGHLTEKADVYAFGVLSLEILAGRPNLDQRLEKT